MATATQNRKPMTEPTPLYALVGATDLAVETARHALADAAGRRAEMQAQFEQLQAELAKRRTEVRRLIGEPKKLQAELEQVPGLVLGRTMEAAAKAETRYEELAARGKSLVERLRSQRATQDFIDQGKATISRTKAAVTTARHTAEDVAASARETLTVGKREATTGAEATKEAVEGTATTARKRVVRTRSATKSAVTSARRTAAAAADAVEAGAEKVGH